MNNFKEKIINWLDIASVIFIYIGCSLLTLGFIAFILYGIATILGGS